MKRLATLIDDLGLHLDEKVYMAISFDVASGLRPSEVQVVRIECTQILAAKRAADAVPSCRREPGVHAEGHPVVARPRRNCRDDYLEACRR